MGRVLEALKRVGQGRPSTPEDSPPRLVLHPDYGAEQRTEAGEEETIPFIEVGPHKAVEGSPSVLNALRPKGRIPKPSVPPPVPRGEDGARPTAPPPAQAKEESTGQVPSSPGDRGAADGHHRELLHSLLAALPAVRRPVLLFLAPFAEADGAKIVVDVARAAAREGRRVIVADGYPAAEGVAARLGFPRTPGLCDVLAGEVALDRALRPTDQEGLSVLPAGGAVGGRGLRFVAETMRSVVRLLRQRADLVLVAGPSGLAADEARLLPVCDGALLVLPANQAESLRADEMLQVIRERGTAVTGCILI